MPISNDIDPLDRLIRLLESTHDWMGVGQRHLSPQISQLRALRELLQERHGIRWWHKLGLPPMWDSDGSENDKSNRN